MTEKQKKTRREQARQEDPFKKVGSKIRAERRRLGFSLEQLSKRVGVSKGTLHRIETGVTSPSLILLSEISRHLKRPVDSLIREGKTTKEIAEVLNSSPGAIDFHRNNIRNKLGLKNKNANLRSYLLSLA